MTMSGVEGGTLTPPLSLSHTQGTATACFATLHLCPSSPLLWQQKHAADTETRASAYLLTVNH